MLDEQARRRIAQSAYELVVEGGHTYGDRVRALCDWVAEDDVR
jgi:hypothetical protein